VIYSYPEDDEVDPDSLSPHDLLAHCQGEAQVVYVIHARELNEAERRQSRKRG
jgi:hypothetical protein